jgi:hypothetical protein
MSEFHQYLHDFTQFSFSGCHSWKLKNSGYMYTDDNQSFLIESGYGILSESSTALKGPCRGEEAIARHQGACPFRDTVVFQSKISTASHISSQMALSDSKVLFSNGKVPSKSIHSDAVTHKDRTEQPAQHLLPYPVTPSVACPSNISRTSFLFASPLEPFPWWTEAKL